MSAEFPPAVLKMVRERSGQVCEVCGSCNATDTHHRRARGMGSTKRPDSSTASAALDLCRGCHRLIESHRLLALTCGWLVPQHDSPLTTPVVYRGRSVFLSDSGEVLEEAA